MGVVSLVYLAPHVQVARVRHFSHARRTERRKTLGFACHALVAVAFTQIQLYLMQTDAAFQDKLYDDVYINGNYADKHWDVGTQAALLQDILIADAGPHSKLFPDNGPGAVVLDAGAGRGAVLYWLEDVQQYTPIKGAHGIELSQAAVQSSPWPDLLRTNQLQQGSLAAMKWENATFDLVYSHEVLEHIPTVLVPACVSEMVRVSKGVLVMTISMRLAGIDDRDSPHLHITCKSRHWWDEKFADAGCFPDLEILAFLWRDPRSEHSLSHPRWQPYSEPWIFAYRCPQPLDAAVARARLEKMQLLPDSPFESWPILDQGEEETTLGLQKGCRSDGWCDLFHPSVYHLTEQNLIAENGGKPAKDGGWLASRHKRLHIELYGF